MCICSCVQVYLNAWCISCGRLQRCPSGIRQINSIHMVLALLLTKELSQMLCNPPPQSMWPSLCWCWTFFGCVAAVAPALLSSALHDMRTAVHAWLGCRAQWIALLPHSNTCSSSSGWLVVSRLCRWFQTPGFAVITKHCCFLCCGLQAASNAVSKLTSLMRCFCMYMLQHLTAMYVGAAVALCHAVARCLQVPSLTPCG